LADATELRPGLKVRALRKAGMDFETTGTIETINNGIFGPWTVTIRPDIPTQRRIQEHTSLNPDRLLMFAPQELAVEE
jgi:hypothetical protein